MLLCGNAEIELQNLCLLFKNISIFSSIYSRAALIPKLNEERTEIMCLDLFTGRTVQNIIKIMVLFVFFFLP